MDRVNFRLGPIEKGLLLNACTEKEPSRLLWHTHMHVRMYEWRFLLILINY